MTIHVSELPCCMPNQVIGVAVILHTIVFNIVLPKEEPLGVKHCKKDEVLCARRLSTQKYLHLMKD